MRLADAIATRDERISTRGCDLKERQFAELIPARVARATVIEGTPVFEHLASDPRRTLDLFKLKTIPPWHLSFVEMKVAPRVRAGVFFCREESPVNSAEWLSRAAVLVQNTQGVAYAVNVVASVDKATGLTNGDTTILTPTTPAWDGFIDELSTCYSSALMTFAFAHCKNVSVSRKETPPKLAKKFERRHGVPPLVYHVLDIAPVLGELHRGGGEGSDAARALHICRGHFRTYSETRKLFGKLAGTFWIDEHARGEEDVGVVVKDFRIPEIAA